MLFKLSRSSDQQSYGGTGGFIEEYKERIDAQSIRKNNYGMSGVQKKERKPGLEVA